MSSNYLFNEVTGQSDYERQSWRDSYNGGRAAGDITGNVNRELDRERDAFQGATWSGSSTQYSALELAQRMGGAGQPVAASGSGAPKSSGPGNEVVTQGPVTPGRPAGGSGAGSRLVVSGGDAPLKATMKDTATGGYAGVQIHPNRWFSDVQEFWEPRYGEPGEWLGGIVNIGADGWHNSDAKRGGPLRTEKITEDVFNAPAVMGGWARTIGQGFLDTRAGMRDPFGPDHPTPGFSTGGF